MIRNSIRLATVLRYEGPYAAVALKQGEDMFGEEDRTVEEVMLTRSNSMSQNLPDVGVDVLIAFDDTGEPYLLGVVGSENQPPPAPDNPGTIVTDNGTVNATMKDDGEATLDNGEIKLTVSDDGKIAFDKTSLVLGPVELVTILVDALNLIATSTCPPGGPLSNAPLITVEKLKLAEFKI